MEKIYKKKGKKKKWEGTNMKKRLTPTERESNGGGEKPQK